MSKSFKKPGKVRETKTDKKALRTLKKIYGVKTDAEVLRRVLRVALIASRYAFAPKKTLH